VFCGSVAGGWGRGWGGGGGGGVDDKVGIRTHDLARGPYLGPSPSTTKVSVHTTKVSVHIQSPTVDDHQI